MKSWIVAVVSLVLGVAVGAGLTWYEFKGVQEVFAEGTGAERAKLNEPAPKAKVEGGNEHSFGTMEVGATKSHEFLIRNAGTLPLTLTAGDKPSCQCTQFEVPKEPIPPGETAKVFLEWKPKVFNADFTQVAEVRTNDPIHATVRLTIQGSVLQFARPIPPDVTLNSISTNEERATTVRLLAYTVDELKIASHEFVESETASLFDLQTEPLAVQQLSGERFAKTGLNLRITAKPGLPLGALNQTIRLTFEGSPPRQLEIPIKGTVVSDISIVGGENFDSEKNILRLGLLKSTRSSKTVLRLLAKGPHRREAALKIIDIDPAEVLRATLSEPTEINDGKVMVYLLTVEIPPDSARVNRIASGNTKAGVIRVETKVPGLKELNIQVSFAVED